MNGVRALIPAELGTLCFSVPLIPQSVNHYKMPNGKGGFYVTKEAQSFKDAVAMIGRTAARELPIPGRYYEVKLIVYVCRAKFHRGDSDNMEKLLFDALTSAGIVKDDRYITRHTHNRVPVELAAQERTEYFISGREEP